MEITFRDNKCKRVYQKKSLCWLYYCATEAKKFKKKQNMLNNLPLEYSSIEISNIAIVAVARFAEILIQLLRQKNLELIKYITIEIILP